MDGHCYSAYRGSLQKWMEIRVWFSILYAAYLWMILTLHVQKRIICHVLFAREAAIVLLLRISIVRNIRCHLFGYYHVTSMIIVPFMPRFVWMIRDWSSHLVWTFGWLMFAFSAEKGSLCITMVSFYKIMKNYCPINITICYWRLVIMIILRCMLEKVVKTYCSRFGIGIIFMEGFVELRGLFI